MHEKRTRGDHRSLDTQAKKNVEMVSVALLDAAAQLRQKATDAMTDTRFSDADRVEISEGLGQAISQLEAKAEWWKVGDGPSP